MVTLLAADSGQDRSLVGLTDSNGHGLRIGEGAVADGEGDIKGTCLRRCPGEAGIGEGSAGGQSGGGVRQGVTIGIGGGEIDLKGGTDCRILADDRCRTVMMVHWRLQKVMYCSSQEGRAGIFQFFVPGINL